MIDLKTKRIAVTGGKGFLGTHLIRKLKEDRGCQHVFISDLLEHDLRKLEDIKRMYEDQNPDIIIHLVAVVGGIGANKENPGRFFYDNAIMGIQLMHEAYLRKIEKFVALGTICCYLKHTPVPFKEENLWDGYPGKRPTLLTALPKRCFLFRRRLTVNNMVLMPYFLCPSTSMVMEIISIPNPLM